MTPERLQEIIVGYFELMEVLAFIIEGRKDGWYWTPNCNRFEIDIQTLDCLDGHIHLYPQDYEGDEVELKIPLKNLLAPEEVVAAYRAEQKRQAQEKARYRQEIEAQRAATQIAIERQQLRRLALKYPDALSIPNYVELGGAQPGSFPGILVQVDSVRKAIEELHTELEKFRAYKKWSEDIVESAKKLVENENASDIEFMALVEFIAGGVFDEGS